jgi:hypothetical protein
MNELIAEPVVEPAVPVPNGRRRLTRDDIISGQDSGLTTEEVEVPEWGGYVVVKALTGHDRDAFEAAMVRNGGTKKQRLDIIDTRASLVQKTCVEPDGTLTFTPVDIAMLTKKSAAALQRVFLVAQRLSGLSDDDIEEIEQDLKGDPSAGAGSTSP